MENKENPTLQAVLIALEQAMDLADKLSSTSDHQAAYLALRTNVELLLSTFKEKEVVESK